MIDINDSEFLSRIECEAVKSKIMSGKDAAALIQPGDALGISGFTPCGYPKITPHELAERMKETPFQVDIWTGASTGAQIDAELIAVNGVRNRMPYQTNANLRKAINAGQVNYFDLHLSHVAQQIRQGFFDGKTGPDFAIVVSMQDSGSRRRQDRHRSDHRYRQLPGIRYPGQESHHRSQYDSAGGSRRHGRHH